MPINPQLFQLATRQALLLKQGFVPTQPDPSQQMPPTADPGAAGATPGMDPAAMQGGQPPMDPAAMAAQGQPPAGGVPPTDPAAMQTGAPQVSGPPGMAMPAPAAAPQPQAAGGKPKFDPLATDYRIYNMQVLLTAIANALGVTIPPGSLTLPPGSAAAPPAEAALPGGSQDPGTQQQQQQPQGGIQPMQSAGQPEAPAVQLGKTAAELWQDEQEFQNLLFDINREPGDGWDDTKQASTFEFPEPQTIKAASAPVSLDGFSNTAAALAAMLRDIPGRV